MYPKPKRMPEVSPKLIAIKKVNPSAYAMHKATSTSMYAKVNLRKVN